MARLMPVMAGMTIIDVYDRLCPELTLLTIIARLGVNMALSRSEDTRVLTTFMTLFVSFDTFRHSGHSGLTDQEPHFLTFLIKTVISAHFSTFRTFCHSSQLLTHLTGFRRRGSSLRHVENSQ